MCEAESGFRFINGFPDENGMLDGAPVRPNISLGDSLTGLHAAFGSVSIDFALCFVSRVECDPPAQVLALLAKERRKANGKIGGQTVDVSILER